MGRKKVNTPELTTVHMRPEDARYLLRDRRGTEPNYKVIRRFVGKLKAKKENPQLESISEDLIEDLNDNYGTPLNKDTLMHHASLDNQQFETYLSTGVIRKFGNDIYAVVKDSGNQRLTSFQ
jgi:hypothetical protein